MSGNLSKVYTKITVWLFKQNGERITDKNILAPYEKIAQKIHVADLSGKKTFYTEDEFKADWEKQAKADANAGRCGGAYWDVYQSGDNNTRNKRKTFPLPGSVKP